MVISEKIFFLLTTFIFLISCKQESKNERLKVSEISFTKEGELTIYSKKDSIYNPIQNLDIEIADNDYERQTGLMYRKSMESLQGMLFIQDRMEQQGFYMKNTYIPLDIIYLDDTFHIVSFQKKAKPLDETTLPSGVPAQYVLEINAGLSDKWNLKKGDSISYKTSN